MLKKLWLGMVFAGVLATSASTLSAEVVVRIGPPRPLVERRIPPPGRGYVWVNGYQRWDGRGYVWVPGRWELPPRPHARWQAHRWRQRHGQWVFEEGRWR
jgi:hypothetical protein